MSEFVDPICTRHSSSEIDSIPSYMSYLIDPPDPHPEFYRARNAAGIAIQEQFNRLGGRLEEARDYKWVKPELSWPSFDHFTFGYRNQVFAVLVGIVRNGTVCLTSQEIDRCLAACTEHNIVPCLFLVDEATLQPVAEKWNLVHLETRRKIVPEEIATDLQVEMSEWEIRNFCIQIVRRHIEEQGGKIDSFCDLLGIDPQIWFEEVNGQRAWVIVRHYPQINGSENSEWIGFERSNPNLSTFDGYHAAVSMASNAAALYGRDGKLIPLSQRFTGSAPLYRGDEFYIKFEGLQRIYVC